MNKTAWNLTPLFKSDTDPEIEKQRKIVQSEIQKFVKNWRENNTYLNNPKILKKALDEYNSLMSEYGTAGREEHYFWLRMSQDQIDPKIKAKYAKAHEFSIHNYNELQFFELTLAKIPKLKQKEFLNDQNLKEYKHFLEKIFRQADYLLPEREEKIMNLKNDPAYQKWVQMTSSFLSKEEREVLTENNKKEKKNLEELISLISSKNKKVRDIAAKALNDILAKNVEIAEVEINAVLANKKIDDNLRCMLRPDFSRHLSDDIETDVVDTLIKAVSKRYDIAKRYYALKAKLLGVKKLEYHERNVQYGKNEKKYMYQDANKLIYKVLTNLDLEFTKIFNQFIENNQVDVYPKKGKRGGAFCSYWLISQPTYILLNYDNELRDVTTFAHELGHGINSELIKQKQNGLNFGTPMATAEVASTFMEDFVLQEILKGANEETKLSVMVAKLNDDISTIFRQIACYQFEQYLHKLFREKGYLSRLEIGKIFQKHMEGYMGEAVIQSKGSENWWVYWSHIRTYFYVYSYASGLLISKSMQNAFKKDSKFMNKIKEFLSAGLSDSPKNIFKNLGIDITDINFWNKGLNEVESLLNETESLAKKLGKI